MKGYMYTVWIKLPDDDKSFLRLEDILKAGAEALGIEANVEETEFLDTYKE